MSKSPWILVSFAMVAIMAPAACGSSSSSTTSTSTTGAGGSTSSTTTTTTTTTTSVTSGVGGSSPFDAACDAPADAPSKGACFMPTTGAGGSGTGGAGTTTGAGGSGGSGGAGGAGPDCSMVFVDPTACGTCIQDKCCVDLTACKDNADCFACLTDPNVDPAKCTDAAVKALLDTISACANGPCTVECTPVMCNPVTSEGCDVANGEACDLGTNGFTCFPAPNDTDICQECDNANGPFCLPGMHCLEDGGCAHYCCDDGDCGTGFCDKSIIGNPDVGVCLHK